MRKRNDYPETMGIYYEDILDKTARLYPTHDENRRQLKMEILLYLAMSFLDDDQRYIIRARIEGKLEKDIAKELGLTRIWVSRKFNWAIKRLRRIFFDKQDIPDDIRNKSGRSRTFEFMPIPKKTIVPNENQITHKIIDKGISKEIRDKIIKRDGACIFCEGIEDLTVHKLCESKGFNDDNLITLCENCHFSLHKIDILPPAEYEKFKEMMNKKHTKSI